MGKNIKGKECGTGIFQRKDGWYIAGNRSSSEVFVNGKKIEKKEFLKTGDKITLGSINLIFDNKQG